MFPKDVWLLIFDKLIDWRETIKGVSDGFRNLVALSCTCRRLRQLFKQVRPAIYRRANAEKFRLYSSVSASGHCWCTSEIAEAKCVKFSGVKKCPFCLMSFRCQKVFYRHRKHCAGQYVRCWVHSSIFECQCKTKAPRLGIYSHQARKGQTHFMGEAFLGAAIRNGEFIKPPL